MNVSEWVRAVLREERDRERTGRVAVARESAPTYGPSGAGPGGVSRRVRIELEVKADLLASVQARYRLPSPRSAVEYALRRVAVGPMSREEALGMEGVGWEGDLDALRAGDP